MREIKFRGKAIGQQIKGVWIYGYLADGCTIRDPEVEKEYVVDPATIGQFTGLLDKDGKEIYEGDLVNTRYNHIPLHIEWCAKTAGFRESGLHPDPDKTILAVLGNIHDNPELLEAPDA